MSVRVHLARGRVEDIFPCSVTLFKSGFELIDSNHSFTVRDLLCGSGIELVVYATLDFSQFNAGSKSFVPRPGGRVRGWLVIFGVDIEVLQVRWTPQQKGHGLIKIVNRPEYPTLSSDIFILACLVGRLAVIP